jgi:Kef-type K+ transport system membrane component KefB
MPAMPVFHHSFIYCRGRGTGRRKLTALVILAAMKAGGAFEGARLTGFDVRDSLALGCLSNARGLVELIVLNVGLDLGILSPLLFSIMVIMASVTTVIMTPVFKFVLPEEHHGRSALKAS